MRAEPRAVLAIDTATETPGVALRHEQRTRVRPIGWRAAFRETAPAARALLAEAGLDLGEVDAIVVPAGPGSFTGLRIGATLGLALARARRIALHAVPTLEAVAEAYASPGAEQVCAVLDARRGRWFAARLTRSPRGWRTIEGPLDVAPEAARALAGGAPLAGPVPGGGDPGPAAVAAALAVLVARDPVRYRLAAPGDLRLVYARSGVEP